MDFGYGWLFSSFVIGTFGLGFFLYGKKAPALLPLLVGLALMIYPYFISSLVGMWVIAVVLVVIPFVPYILSRR